jgi:radical SAM superfamily enzyme YgiQ (UPF0313 family)
MNSASPILFVFANLTTSFSWSPAVQVLSAVLKREGFATDLVHVHAEHGVPEKTDVVARAILEKKPWLVLYTSTTFEFTFLNEVAGMTRKQGLNCPQILGGIHATLTPESLAGSAFDAYCLGEGEIPVVELARRVRDGRPIEGIPALLLPGETYDPRRHVCVNVPDLNELPFFDWDIQPTAFLLEERKGWLSVAFSRGCPYSCTFCVNQALMRVKGRQGYARKRTVEYALQELEYLAGRFQVKVFNLDDDLLCLDRTWIREFCDAFKVRIFDRYGIRFTINARIDSINQELTDLFAVSGCREVQVGIESGDEGLRNGTLDKRISDEQIFRAFECLHASKLFVLAYLIVGLPGETPATHAKTIALMARIRPYLIRATFYVPIPKTPLYDYCKEHHLLEENSKIAGHFSEPVLRYTTTSRANILRFKALMPWEINIELGLEEYRAAIARFSALDDDAMVAARDQIITLDRELSARHLEKLHYAYFNGNLNYYVRATPASRG